MYSKKIQKHLMAGLLLGLFSISLFAQSGWIKTKSMGPACPGGTENGEYQLFWVDTAPAKKKLMRELGEWMLRFSHINEPFPYSDAQNSAALRYLILDQPGGFKKAEKFKAELADYSSPAEVEVMESVPAGILLSGVKMNRSEAGDYWFLGDAYLLGLGDLSVGFEYRVKLWWEKPRTQEEKLTVMLGADELTEVLISMEKGKIGIGSVMKNMPEELEKTITGTKGCHLLSPADIETWLSSFYQTHIWKS